MVLSLVGQASSQIHFRKLFRLLNGIVKRNSPFVIRHVSEVRRRRTKQVLLNSGNWHSLRFTQLRALLQTVSKTFSFFILGAAILSGQLLWSETKDPAIEQSYIQAAVEGDLSKVRGFLNQGINVDTRHPLTGWSALIAAAYYGHVEIVRLLIESGANVNAKDKNGGTPLLKAVTVGPHSNVSEILQHKAKIVRELLKAGADPQAHDPLVGTAWGMAMVNGHSDLILAFEEAGVKGVKETRMIHAAAAGDAWLLKRMLEDGADVNYKDRDGWSAISEASLSGHIEILKILIGFKADVNLKHKNDWTPLMVAAQKNQEEVVRFLLQSGADPTLRSNDGATAAMIALRQGNAGIAELLK